jgi:hypothetical protein
MHIHAVAMVRNEADIIEAFVRHNLQFVDALTVLVHGSTDSTPEILRALAQEGLPLQVLYDSATGFAQHVRTTSLARNAFTAGADFVFPIDGDELIDAPSRPEFEEILAAIDPGAPALLYLMHHYVPRADDETGESNPARRLRYRLGLGDKPECKVMLTRAFAADPQLEIDLGNHGLLRREGANAKGVPGLAQLPAVRLAHFPVRSAPQLANKVIIGYLAHIAVGLPPNIERGNATHWRAWYEKLVADPTLLEQDFAALAATYHGIKSDTQLVLEPLPCDFELRYPPTRASAPLSALAKFTEHLIRTSQAPKPS